MVHCSTCSMVGCSPSWRRSSSHVGPRNWYCDEYSYGFPIAVALNFHSTAFQDISKFGIIFPSICNIWHFVLHNFKLHRGYFSFQLCQTYPIFHHQWIPFNQRVYGFFSMIIWVVYHIFLKLLVVKLELLPKTFFLDIRFWCFCNTPCLLNWWLNPRSISPTTSLVGYRNRVRKTIFPHHRISCNFGFSNSCLFWTFESSNSKPFSSCDTNADTKLLDE